MKKMILTLFILGSVLVEGTAQEKLKIGDMVNGKLKITNEAGLRSFFLENIGKTGILDKEIRMEVSPTADRVFAYLKVTGNKGGVTSVGVLLVNIKNEAFIVAGQGDSARTWRRWKCNFLLCGQSVHRMCANSELGLWDLDPPGLM